MKKTILISAASMAAFGVFALTNATADDTSHIEITQPMKMGDSRMTCEQIIVEANNMEMVLGGSPASGLMDGEQMASIGTGLAQNAALYGGALLGRSSKKKKEEEAARKVIAEKRWIYMVGMYEGRNCDAVPAAAAAPAE